MKRGSTPTNTFEVDIDLTGATVFISYRQKKQIVFEKSGADVEIEPTKLTVQLTQEETLAFEPGDVEMQIRYVFPNGKADASDFMKTRAEAIIKDGVIEP